MNDILEKTVHLRAFMLKLKKFLNEFSRIKERQVIEVKLWKEYLIFAQIFGRPSGRHVHIDTCICTDRKRLIQPASYDIPDINHCNSYSNTFYNYVLPHRTQG